MVDLRQYARSPENPASPEAIFAYQQRVGSALYAACLTRPDAARTTSHLTEFSTNPDKAHAASADRAIGYLQNTKTLAIQYSAPTDLSQPVFEAYSDSAFADDEISRRSSSGYLIRLFGGPIDWKAYKQRSVATSTTEAELHALTEAVKEIYYWQRIFRDIGLCLQHDVAAAPARVDHQGGDGELDDGFNHGGQRTCRKMRFHRGPASPLSGSNDQ